MMEVRVGGYKNDTARSNGGDCETVCERAVVERAEVLGGARYKNKEKLQEERRKCTKERMRREYKRKEV